MGQQPNESAKDFIQRVRDDHKRPGGSFAHDLPRTTFDPDKVTMVKDNPKPSK